MATKYTVSTVFRAIDQYSKQVSTMTSATTKFASSVSKIADAASKKLDGMAGSLDKITTAAVSAAAPLGVVGGAAVKSAMDFEDALVGASTKFGEAFYKGTAGYDQLAAASMAASKTGVVGFTEAASALGNLGAAGLDGVTAIGALNDVVALSKVSGSSLEEAANMAVNAMGALGLAADTPAQKIASLRKTIDVMGLGSDMTAATLTDMAEAIKVVGPIANALNVPLEQTGAALTVLASGGIMGTMAGTGAANMMKRLSKQTGPATKYMRQLGFEAVRTADGGLDLVKTLDAMRNATAGMDLLAKQDIVGKIVGDEAGTAVAAALNKTDVEWQKFVTSMGQTGVVQQKFAVMGKTASADIGKLKNSVMALGVTLGQALMPQVTGAAGKLFQWVEGVGQVLSKNEALRAQLAGGLVNALLGAAKAVAILWSASMALKAVSAGVTAAKWAWVTATWALNAAMWMARAAVVATTVVVALFKASTWSSAATILWCVGALIAQKAALAAGAVVTGVMTVAQWGLNAAMAVAAAPVWLLIAAIAAIIAVGVLLWNYWDPISKWWGGIWGGITSAVTSAIDFIMAPIKWLLSAFDQIMEGVGMVSGAAGQIDTEMGSPLATGASPGTSGGGTMGFEGALGIDVSTAPGTTATVTPAMPSGVSVRQATSGGT